MANPSGFWKLWDRLFGESGANERKEICPRCYRKSSLDRRDCENCGAVVIPQSHWDKL